jgi:hypothetical protein
MNASSELELNCSSEIYASVQTKIPMQLETGFSGVQAHVDKTIQPLYTDFGHMLSIMQEQNHREKARDKALIFMAAAMQGQSQENIPQPPPYSPIPPSPPVEKPLSFPMVATTMKRYKILASENLPRGLSLQMVSVKSIERVSHMMIM